MAKATTFTRDSAARIAGAVRKVEGAQTQNSRQRYATCGDTFGRVIVGKTDAATTAGSAVTVSVWDGTQGSEADTGDNVSAYNYSGYIAANVWVSVVETVRGYVILSPEGRLVLGKTDAALAKSASGTISIYFGTTPGSESDSGANVTAYNRYAAIAIDKWVHCALLEGNWHIIVAEVC